MRFCDKPQCKVRQGHAKILVGRGPFDHCTTNGDSATIKLVRFKKTIDTHGQLQIGA